MVAVVTQAPRFVVLKPNAEGTTSTGGSSEAVAATVIVSKKGTPGVPIEVTEKTWKSILGTPFSMIEGTKAEGLRHLSDALKGCGRAYIVRAIADDARYPAITLKNDGSIQKTNHAFGSDVVPGDGSLISFFVKNGDVDSQHSIEIKNSDIDAGTFDLHVYGVDSNGEAETVEVHEDLSLDIYGKNDFGGNSYAESALVASSIIGCFVSSSADKANLKNLVVSSFVGGTSGSEPSSQNIKDAWDVLRYSQKTFHLAMAAGQYDTDVLSYIDGICDELMVQFRLDVPPTMTEEEANDWVIDLNFGSSFVASVYHYPYKANDQFSGGKSAWGVSGEATAAKARCFATNSSRPDVPGVHLAAAGLTRGSIDRTGIEPLHTKGFTSAESKVEVRDKSGKIVGRYNPVPEGKVIGDGLTTYAKKNYLRYEHVVAIYFAMSREVKEAAEALKWEPDGITENNLDKLTGRIGQKYIDSGALVTPRNPDEDGTEPVVFNIKQAEIDLWSIDMSICPTGTFRRGSLQTILMR